MCSILPPLEGATLPTGFCAYTLPVTINQARSVVSMMGGSTSDFFVLERGTQSIVQFIDTNHDGIVDKRITIASAPQLNHGLAYQDGYLYASSDEIVYRWEYNNMTQSNPINSFDNPQQVIHNMNDNGSGSTPQGHVTRTLLFDNKGRLYISVGSNANVDSNSFRSRIRRFDLSTLSSSSSLEGKPIDFTTGEVFADGLRNEVGLALDRFGIVWGVENGADQLIRTDLGGDIHNDNPGEELNRFKEEDAGKHWGYPYCWTEYNVPEPYGMGKGTVWAWPSFMDDNITDEDCRTNYMRSELSMQAHTAPLGLTFYHYPEDLPPECPPGTAFPKEMDGYAFIALHGSWNRDVPVGYSVVYVEMDENGDVVGEPKDILTSPSTVWEDGFRPVDVDFDSCGRLLVTSDGSHNINNYRGSKIVRIESVTTSSSPSEENNDKEAETTNSSKSSDREDGPTIVPQSFSLQVSANIFAFIAMQILLYMCVA